MERRIPDLNRRFEGLASQEIFQRSRSCTCSDGDAAEECNTASSVAVCGVRHFVVVEFAAELQSMPPGDVGNVIDHLGDGVGSLKLRPLEAAQAGEEITAKSDARQATGKRPTYASIQPIV